jgi:hypothetical protein
MMLRTGSLPDIWRDFSLAKAYQIKFHKFPDDQGWIWHKLPNASGWKVGPESGIWSFRKRGWPHDDKLPLGARLVCFPGAADPDQVKGLPWIKTHWQ